AAAWANLHGAVALLVPILSTAAVAAERFRRRGAAWGPWAAPLCLSFAAVLATPHGTALFPQMWRTVTYPGKARIRDWAPPWIELPGLYGALLVLGLWAAWRLREKRPACAAWTALLAAASLTMTRNVPLYLLAAGAAAARAWDPSLLKEHERRALAACLLAVAAGAGLQARANAFLEGKRGIGTIEPLAGAAAFIKEADLPGRMFNEYESGGYLIWALAPGRKVFLDGRNAEFDPPVLHRGLSWYRPEVWRALDNAWGFDYALIARHVTGAYTAKVLEDDPAWAPVYWDDEAMVYLRRTPAHRPLLERYGYALVKPGRASQQYLEPILEKGGGPALLKELDRSVAECRRGPINALLLRAYVLARLGRAAQAGESAEDAVRRAPGRAQPLMTLGWVRLAAGDLEGARLAYEEAAARVRRDERPALGADVLNNLGRVYEKQGDRGRAAEAYRRALAWNPGHGEAFQNLRRLE
ncbi:MAG TPA: tetratricopeptide repeat protein, partial [Elusimicrobiota bacterium]|nr:tetratricopeptide repeat protein [Elusimicrobiota bacterium]